MDENSSVKSRIFAIRGTILGLMKQESDETSDRAMAYAQLLAHMTELEHALDDAQEVLESLEEDLNNALNTIEGLRAPTYDSRQIC